MAAGLANAQIYLAEGIQQRRIGLAQLDAYHEFADDLITFVRAEQEYRFLGLRLFPAGDAIQIGGDGGPH